MSEQLPPKPDAVPVAPVVLATLETASKHRSDYANVWPWLEERLKERVEAGRELYGSELMTGSEIDALACAWDAAVVTVMYLTKEWLEGHAMSVGVVLSDARKLLLHLSRLLWERERVTPTFEEMCDQINADNQAAKAAGIPRPSIDQWSGWRGASEPE